MGGSASVEMGHDAQWRAFLELRDRYESEYANKSSCSNSAYTDEDLMVDFKQRFITMLNSDKFSTPLTDEEKAASRAKLLNLLASGNDDDTATGTGTDSKYDDNNYNRMLCIGDIVKVVDDGFWCEGVIIAIYDQDHIVVDFGVEQLDGYIAENMNLSLDMPTIPTYDENSVGSRLTSKDNAGNDNSGTGTGTQTAEEDSNYYLDDDGPRQPGNESGEYYKKIEENKDSSGSSTYIARPRRESHTLSKKTVKACDCILIKCGEELEVGDKVEMCPVDSFMYFVGHIWVINRIYNPITHHITLTYDICMEGSSGEAFAPKDNIALQERILQYEDMKAKGISLPDELDIECDVHPNHIRKLLSGRVQVNEKWRSAWRKVTAMMAFKGAGFARATKSNSKGSKESDGTEEEV